MRVTPPPEWWANGAGGPPATAQRAGPGGSGGGGEREAGVEGKGRVRESDCKGIPCSVTIHKC